MTDTLTGRMTSSGDDLKDFSRARARVRFRIDQDVFEAASALPAEILVEFSNKFAGITDKTLRADELFGAIREVFSLVLLPESYDRMTSRLRDQTNPVDLEQMSDTLVWLVEQYGLRPTPPSSSSPSGPVLPAPGTGLTESTPVVASTFDPFPPTGS